MHSLPEVEIQEGARIITKVAGPDIPQLNHRTTKYNTALGLMLSGQNDTIPSCRMLYTIWSSGGPKLFLTHLQSEFGGVQARSSVEERKQSVHLESPNLRKTELTSNSCRKPRLPHMFFEVTCHMFLEDEHIQKAEKNILYLESDRNSDVCIHNLVAGFKLISNNEGRVVFNYKRL